MRKTFDSANARGGLCVRRLIVYSLFRPRVIDGSMGTTRNEKKKKNRKKNLRIPGNPFKNRVLGGRSFGPFVTVRHIVRVRRGTTGDDNRVRINCDPAEAAGNGLEITGLKSDTYFAGRASSGGDGTEVFSDILSPFIDEMFFCRPFRLYYRRRRLQ